MIYEFKCPKCSAEFNVSIRLADYDSSAVECEECLIEAVRHFRTPTATIIPQHMQASPNASKREAATVPINIFDEKPDGGYRVTRIGKKEDIHND